MRSPAPGAASRPWLALLALGAVALPAAAQEILPPPPFVPAAFEPRAVDGGSILLERPSPLAGAAAGPEVAPALLLPTVAAPADSLPCPECAPPRRFWFGALELMIAQAIPLTYNAVIRDAEWAQISLKSWGDNLQFPWQWDNNQFVNNQFSHPYHGSLYFNSARANGYDFWQSAPWAFAGSLMWELFGEVWAPSPNDLLNTSLGGIALGETLYRLSSAIIENEATGFERVARETGAFLLNPIRGFSRLVHGDATRVTRTPGSYRPSKFYSLVEVGGRRFATSADITDTTALDQGYVQFLLQYGDQFEDVTKSPFSTLQVSGMITSNSGTKAKGLGELRAYGNLWGKHLGSDTSNVVLVARMTYDYFSNAAFELGGQGFQAGIRAATDRGRPWRFVGEALARANPIAATRSDYFVTAEGRDYDYGVGGGAALRGLAVWAGRLTVDVNGSYLWIPVLSGFAGDHHNWFFTASARGYLFSRIGIGALYGRYWRNSQYDFQPDVSQNSSEGRVFLTLAIPRWY